jgi:hypothetical protein
MEPSRLRGVAVSAEAAAEHPEKPANAGVKEDVLKGSLPRNFINTIRVIGFYSSPVVLELIYSGFLMGTPPTGRDSATRFITQAQLMAVRRKGLIASHVVTFKDDKALAKLVELSFDLAQMEREEGQIDIIQNIEAMFKSVRQRVGVAEELLPEDAMLPQDVYAGQLEWTDAEMVEANKTGGVPQHLQILAQEFTSTK